MAQTRSRANARQKALALPDGLNTEALLDIYATMVLVRTLDEAGVDDEPAGQGRDRGLLSGA